MLDQSFTPDNFRKIFDYENRKGVYLEKIFFPEVIELTGKIKDLTIEIRSTYKLSDKVSSASIRKEKYEERRNLKQKKEDLLEAKFSAICDHLFEKSFQIKLTRNDSILEKPVYIQEKTAEVFFSLKQLQYNFYKLYKVKQSDRYAIASQLKTILNDGFPKVVVRTDIKSFYESIPHERLQKKINEENLLSFFSKRMITQILKEYRLKSNTNKGLPRGIGISAYLAELYLRDLDRDIRAMPNVTYFARYVDDIIVIFTPPTIETPQHYQSDLTELIESEKYELNINSEKTKDFDLRDKYTKKSHSFEYLGYKFNFGYGLDTKPLPVTTHLSEKKIEKYQIRIKSAILNYINYKNIDEKKARKLLIKRINFLTSNTRLKNNKKNILTGIFYSHSHLTDETDLTNLDTFFQNELLANSLPISLSIRLSRKSFEKGFKEKRFIPFSTNELNIIMKIWKKDK